ncbi:hypothetical protein K504DRAFT_77632 [Pleomassaria siparia CBS 279.74]|uniref:Uncharacterized protein n=1 Tax=Pleomassaria siparia CBS 279.74 TaxID=1314801 RepID=A0A6G1K1A4_9PLEO|nr:hypothetical protein K504DRAFT_77632 [Pleomassaria siparia CBS 279.74]
MRAAMLAKSKPEMDQAAETQNEGAEEGEEDHGGDDAGTKDKESEQPAGKVNQRRTSVAESGQRRSSDTTVGNEEDEHAAKKTKIEKRSAKKPLTPTKVKARQESQTPTRPGRAREGSVSIRRRNMSQSFDKSTFNQGFIVPMTPSRKLQKFPRGHDLDSGMRTPTREQIPPPAPNSAAADNLRDNYIYYVSIDNGNSISNIISNNNNNNGNCISNNNNGNSINSNSNGNNINSNSNVPPAQCPYKNPIDSSPQPTHFSIPWLILIRAPDSLPCNTLEGGCPTIFAHLEPHQLRETKYGRQTILIL